MAQDMRFYVVGHGDNIFDTPRESLCLVHQEMLCVPYVARKVTATGCEADSDYDCKSNG